MKKTLPSGAFPVITILRFAQDGEVQCVAFLTTNHCLLIAYLSTMSPFATILSRSLLWALLTSSSVSVRSMAW